MSSVIFYWIARFLQNLKFYVVINNFDNRYSHAKSQIKSKKEKNKSKICIILLLRKIRVTNNFHKKLFFYLENLSFGTETT